jgi:cell division protein FtsQ
VRRVRRVRGPGARRSGGRPTALAVAILLGCVLAALGLGWLRESSLVAVREVTITGLHGRAAPAVRQALRRAATDMTTLHVRMDELRRAVAPYPIVKDLRVSTDFPRRLRIRVVEYDAVATVTFDGRRVPVASDGTLLRDEPVPGGLPTLSAEAGEGARRLSDRRALGAVDLLAAAPRDLRPLVDAVRWDAGGLHVQLRSGAQMDFGGPGRLRAKWIAAAGVLSDPRAAGASYLDLRVPERPVAGPFPDPVADGGDAVGSDTSQDPSTAGDAGLTADQAGEPAATADPEG